MSTYTNLVEKCITVTFPRLVILEKPSTVLSFRVKCTDEKSAQAQLTELLSNACMSIKSMKQDFMNGLHLLQLTAPGCTSPEPFNVKIDDCHLQVGKAISVVIERAIADHYKKHGIKRDMTESCYGKEVEDPNSVYGLAG